MKECAGAVGTLADKRSEGSQMDETLKLRWLCCPRCGGKTRTQDTDPYGIEGFSAILPKVQIHLRDSFQGRKN